MGLSEKLKGDDLLITEKKYAAPRICHLSDEEILTNTAECILRIHVITGWNLPGDESYMKVLTEEFMNKLKEDFSMMNFQEVVFAMRKNVGVQDWGKNMNLELISGILSKYCQERSRVSAEEEILSGKHEQKILTDEQMDDITRGEIEVAFQAMKRGSIPLIFDSFGEVLLKDKLIADITHVSDFFVWALNSKVENIYTPAK